MDNASVYFKGLVTVLICTLVFAIIAIPLILRKIPRNKVSGFRTPATLADDFVWYEANAHFGRGFFMSSIVSAMTILIFYNTSEISPESFVKLSMIILVVPPLIAALMTQRFINTLKK